MNSLALRASILVWSSVAVSCNPAPPIQDMSCDSLSDCPLDEACDVVNHRCVVEPVDGFIGRFACTLRAPGSQSYTQSDTAEIVGKVGASRWVFTNLATCSFDTATDDLKLQFYMPGELTSLLVRVTGRAAATGSVQLGIASEPFAVNGATFCNSDTGDCLAFSARGYLLTANTVALASELQGYLQVDMHRTSDVNARFGQSCPRGMADCGRKLATFGGAIACGSLGDTTEPICLRTCTDNSECAIGSASCAMLIEDMGLCLKSCTMDSDCAWPQSCTAFDAANGASKSVCQ